MITCTFENGRRASLRHVVVHAVVEKDGALLLVRRAPHLLEGDKWGLPGGFLDRDESLSEGILRELKRRLRRSLTRSDRARGLLSVRSLGLG